jgi:hypothetical protein
VETERSRNAARSLDQRRTTNQPAPMGVSPGELRSTSCKQEVQDVAASLDQRPPTFALVWVTGS